jgi:hypothetical protein
MQPVSMLAFVAVILWVGALGLGNTIMLVLQQQRTQRSVLLAQQVIYGTETLGSANLSGTKTTAEGWILGIDLQNAKLTDEDLRGAELRGAKLNNALLNRPI